MIRMRLWVTVLVVLTICGCNQPGLSPELSESVSVRLGQVTMPGQKVNSPHQMILPRKGTVILEIGNPTDEPVLLSFEKASPDQVLLPGKRWTQIQLEAVDRVGLSWQGESLYLGSRYLKPKGKAKQPNILLVSVDTLRWDRFNQNKMPGLWQLFQEGSVFERAYSPTPWTLPAHASMLAGQYPAKHGVRLGDAKLPPAVETLAERLRDQGYYNWALTEGNFVSARYGLNQGFHRYIETAPAMMASEVRKASKLEANLGRARRRIDQLADTPQFLFLHTYEVHCPYLVRGEVKDPDGLGQTQWLLDNDGKDLGEATFEHLAKLYDQEVAYTDQLLTPFIRALWETGKWMIVFTSDHGEEFGDHGGLLHGDTLYEETLHVPLAMLGPKIETQTIATPCSLVDIAPTILSYLNLELPKTWQGHSLLEPYQARPVFAESFFWGVHIKVEDPQLMSVLDGQRKLIQARNFGEMNAELYFLDGDPLEQDNRQARDIPTRDQLFLLLDAYQKNRALTPDQAEDLTPEQLEAMRALGYVQ